MGKKRSERSKSQLRAKRAVKKSSRRAKKRKLSPKEHVKKISFNYRKRAEKIKQFRHPLGIKVIVAYLFLLLLFYFVYLFVGFKSPIAVIFGQVIGGMPALFLVTALIIVTIILIAGLFKRKKWSYHLSLLWFAFGIINSLVSLATLKTEVVSFTRSFLILSSITVFVINILAILYIVSEKRYFFASQFLEKKVGIVDKLFVAALVIFLIVTISIGSALGYDFYTTNIKQADLLISELNAQPIEQQMQICNSKPGQQKDLCLLIVSIKSGTKAICNQIQSDFYKFSCLQT